MARPSKLTPFVQVELCKGLELGMTIAAACRRVGITDSTYRRWRARGRDSSRDRGGVFRAFCSATEKAVANNQARHLKIVNLAGEDGSWQASAWILERRHGYTRSGAASVAPKEEPAATEVPTLTGPEQQLAELRRMRTQAEEAKSWVAATQLLRAEREVSAEIVAQRELDKKIERAGVPDISLVDGLAATIRDLPDGLRSQLRELVGV